MALLYIVLWFGRRRLRHSVGVIAICVAKTRPKCELSLKPHANAISVTDRCAASEAQSSSAARAIRSAKTRFITVSSRSAKIR